MLKGKEESAPSFIFDTYWYSYYKNLNLLNNYSSVYTKFMSLQEASLPMVAEYSEYDFRN
jgi:hypothetical protein